MMLCSLAEIYATDKAKKKVSDGEERNEVYETNHVLYILL